MIYRFEDFEVDRQNYTIAKAGETVHVEPLVFDLLVYFLDTAGRVVSRDDIVDGVWHGRIISDASISSAIKAVRKALGDSGSAQRFLKTIHRRGFLFEPEVAIAREAEAALRDAAPVEEIAPRADLRGEAPSIAVLPFDVVAGEVLHPALADAIPHDIIQGLSRLRSLRVIARGSAFRFRGGAGVLDAVKAGLNVRYCLTGVIEPEGMALTISFELIDLRNDTTIWVEKVSGSFDGVHELRADIVRMTATSVEAQITQHEARSAQFVSSENLDAWSRFHLGLASMYRFSEAGTFAAVEHFERAVALDPTFARAHAGLSFANYQIAFNRYGNADVPAYRGEAIATAERAMELDALDPFCNFVRGRAHFFSGEFAQSRGLLDRSTAINPNFAQAFYSRGLAAVMSGEGEVPIEAAAMAQTLSPLDPLLFGFYGLAGFAHMAEGDLEAAREWMERGATAPGALVVMDMAAVAANHLAGDERGAANWAARTRSRNPAATGDYFFGALPFQSPDLRGKLEASLKHYGF